jgi:DNA modification methylase
MPASLDAATRLLAITYRSPADLRPDPLNPRVHPARQIKALCRVIKTLGFVSVVIVDEAGVIIAGVGRWLAAKKLELQAIPTVTVTGLSEAEKHALRIADNKMGLESSWSPDVLKTVLLEIRSLDLNIDLSAATGFSVGEIDVVLNLPSADADDDQLPEAPPSPRAKLGDVWRLGPHRIGCGDCRDATFMRRVVGPKVEIAAAFLDPPFNVRINGHANSRGRHREFAMGSGEMTEAEFMEFLEASLGACVAVSRDGAVHFICMDWRHMDALSTAARSAYGKLLNLCVWNKSNGGMGSLYRSKHELISVYRVGKAEHFNAVELGRHGRNRTNVWDYPSVNTGGARRSELAWHPTVKPVAMVADAIKDVTRQGEIVLDCFLGSGTTLIAAERASRVCRGVELDPAYVDLAIERWEAMTGLTAELEAQPGVWGRPDGWGAAG